MKTFLQTVPFVIILAFQSCKENRETDNRIESWYIKIRNEILSNSNQQEDSVFYDKKEESLHVTYFLNGKKLRQEYRSADTLTVHFIRHYGQNERFELRSEIHGNGQKATEGITYIDNYYGPWTVWYGNGQIMYRGYRYEDEDFGKWIYFNENGERDKVVDNKNMFFTDSILHKSSLHTTAAL